jgi:hypothetical protein
MLAALLCPLPWPSPRAPSHGLAAWVNTVEVSERHKDAAGHFSRVVHSAPSHLALCTKVFPVSSLSGLHQE